MSVQELTAQPCWQAVDFISDLHLQASEAATFNAWQLYMRTTTADAMFILGDLFEVWFGDDVLQVSGFEQQCAAVIKHTSARLPIFFMHGNRDFLVGSGLMAACNATLMDDPTVLTFNDHRWLLSHGDSLCIDDKSYMAFRQQVREPDWKQTFLAKPFAERQSIARGLRQQSQAQHDVKKHAGVGYADVDTSTARQLLINTNSTTLIHGHTHKPAAHELGNGLRRMVLSDWDLAASPPRADVLRLSNSGVARLPLINLL